MKTSHLQLLGQVKKKSVSVPARPLKKRPTQSFFQFLFSQFVFKNISILFCDGKTWQKSELVVRKLKFSAFQYDVYRVYVCCSMPEHLEARTTISRDMFYYILASKLPSKKNNNKNLPPDHKISEKRTLTNYLFLLGLTYMQNKRLC